MARAPDPPTKAGIGYVHYVDVQANKIVESVVMREFYDWNPVSKRYEYSRCYELAREEELNPEFYRKQRGLD